MITIARFNTSPHCKMSLPIYGSKQGTVNVLVTLINDKSLCFSTIHKNSLLSVTLNPSQKFLCSFTLFRNVHKELTGSSHCFLLELSKQFIMNNLFIEFLLFSFFLGQTFVSRLQKCSDFSVLPYYSLVFV